MKKISEILKNTREDNDITQMQVMRDTGINNKTLSGYENGVAEPDIETLVTLFKYYNISADEVFGLKKNSSSISLRERRLISEYRLLNDTRKEDIIKIIKALNN